MQSTYVLVPGAWYGGWIYARVAQRLRSAGHVALFERFRDSVAGNPRWKTCELACGHNVMIDLPAETAAILTERGRPTGSPRATRSFRPPMRIRAERE